MKRGRSQSMNEESNNNLQKKVKKNEGTESSINKDGVEYIMIY